MDERTQEIKAAQEQQEILGNTETLLNDLLGKVWEKQSSNNIPMAIYEFEEMMADAYEIVFNLETARRV